MSSDHRCGITLEEPDVAHWYLAGDVTVDDIREIYDIQLKFCQDKHHIFLLVNVKGIRSVSADARKLAAEGPKRGKLVMPIRGNAIVGATFHFRVLGTLIAKAAQLIHQEQDNPTAFFETEAEARAWIAERRVKVETSSLRRK